MFIVFIMFHVLCSICMCKCLFVLADLFSLQRREGGDGGTWKWNTLVHIILAEILLLKLFSAMRGIFFF